MADIKFEIIKMIGMLSKPAKGWAKDLYGLTDKEIAIVKGTSV